MVRSQGLPGFTGFEWIFQIRLPYYTTAGVCLDTKFDSLKEKLWQLSSHLHFHLAAVDHIWYILLFCFQADPSLATINSMNMNPL